MTLKERILEKYKFGYNMSIVEKADSYISIKDCFVILDAYTSNLVAEMEKKREDYFWVKSSVRDLIDKAISDCQKLVKEKNG